LTRPRSRVRALGPGARSMSLASPAIVAKVRLPRSMPQTVPLVAGSRSPSVSTWPSLLFPQAKDAQFADGYAQAVSCGLLVVRAPGFS
jgi:hypothetical protein